MADQKLILIVDDEPNFLEIFGAKLSAAGFGIETAANGEEGYKKAKLLKPDLVLMDVKMPVQDGASALMKMREDPETKGLKVLFLTSLVDPKTEIEDVNKRFSEEMGAQGYIRKTVDLAELVETVKRYL